MTIFQTSNDIKRQLDLLPRLERGRLIAGLVNRIGHNNLELAEDVAFLSAETAIAQRLQRGKRKLRRLTESLIKPLTVFDMRDRMGAVLKVDYQMFCLGYAPRSGAKLIPHDVALEALRLARECADQ